MRQMRLYLAANSELTVSENSEMPDAPVRKTERNGGTHPQPPVFWFLELTPPTGLRQSGIAP